MRGIIIICCLFLGNCCVAIFYTIALMISLLFKFISYTFIKMGFHLDFLVGKQERLHLFVRNLYLYHRKVKKANAAQSYLNRCDPRYTVHGILQARMLEWVAFPFSWRSSQARDWTQVSHMQVDYLPAEPPGKPKNTGVGSLSLLQPNPEIESGSPSLQADYLPA